MAETVIKCDLVKVSIKISSTQTVVAAQEGGEFKVKADRIDTTNKDNSGWKTSVAGNRECSLDFDGVVISKDSSQGALRTAALTGATVDVEIAGIDGTGSKIALTMAITDYSLSFPNNDVVKFKASLVGASQPVETAAT